MRRLGSEHNTVATGILVKSPQQLELLARVSRLAFDKTGTLTEGRFRLRQVLSSVPHLSSSHVTEGCRPLPQVTTNEANPRATLAAVIEAAAAVEKSSSHPIAAAFLEYAAELGVDPPPAPQFTLLEEEGLVAVVDGVTVHVGNERLARRVLAETAKANGEPPRTPATEAAATAYAEARAAVTYATREGLPARMLKALQKKENAAREALDAARADARADQARGPGGTPPMPLSAQTTSPPPSPPGSTADGGDECGVGCCGGGCGVPPLDLSSELVARWQQAGWTSAASAPRQRVGKPHLGAPHPIGRLFGALGPLRWRDRRRLPGPPPPPPPPAITGAIAPPLQLSPSPSPPAPPAPAALG